MLSQAIEKNAFLSQLSAGDLAILGPDLVPVPLNAGTFAYRAGGEVSEVIFPNSGLVTMRMPGDKSGAGLVLIGRDGVIAGFLSAALAPALCDAVVLVGGEGLRMPAAAFRRALEISPAMRTLATRFHAAMMAHAQQTASCAITHQVEKRLSRWFLEAADRTGAVDLPLLQSDFANILGVQRTTVNFALGRLEQIGAIVSGRGHVSILDREKLEQCSCDCYGQLKAYVAKLFPAAIMKEAAAACLPAGNFQLEAS